MEKQEKELTKKEQKLQDFMEERRLTVIGYKSVEELNRELGLPEAVLEMARIEVQTGMVENQFLKVDRFVDGKLVYREDLVVTGVSESLIKQVPYRTIRTERVRHPRYDGTKMPKATQAEIMAKKD